MKKLIIPKHIAIIMDGNGRWANEKKLSRIKGHKAGVKTVRKITKFCVKNNIEYLTLFTFSEENWLRPKKEILALMKLLIKSINDETKSLIKNNVRISVIGNFKKIDIYTRTSLNKIISLTKKNTGLKLNLAISYGGRQEIIYAINKILSLNKKNITINNFHSFLYTKDIPDPDLLIRTGKENRISNFLLWQIPYTEIYFSNLYWPDFNATEMQKALLSYKKRERRYGKISEQL